MLVTPRLLLRRWQPADLDPFSSLNADAEVMEHFPEPLDSAASDALAARLDAVFEEHPVGPWAVEHRDSGRFIGYVGLLPVFPEAPFAPAMEIGWRLERAAWGRGFATEAARAALDAAWSSGLSEVVSFTFVGNTRSRAVMERLGMVSDPAEDFHHPRLQGHRLSHHVLYRLRRVTTGHGTARDRWQDPLFGHNACGADLPTLNEPRQG